MPFLTLDTLLLPQPAPVFVAPCMVLGLVALSTAWSKRLLPSNSPVLDHALAFVCTTACVAAVVHLAACVGLLHLEVLRKAGWALALWGLLYTWRHRAWLHTQSRTLWSILQALPWPTRATLVLAVGIATCLGMAALGPATDADSLDYHLGVPLEWLRSGGATPRLDWFHARLVGLGECLNLLGLAAGTDNLGACLQWAGMAVAVIAVTSRGTDTESRILGATLVLACPVMVFLVPNQKPQLFPVAATAAAMALFTDDRRPMDLKRLTLGVGAVTWAIGCKHSFILSGSVVLLCAWWAANRVRLMVPMVAATLAWMVLLPLPVWARNLWFYGDPIPPFLERMKAQPDAAVMAFAQYLRDYGGAFTLQRLLRLPFDLVMTTHPSTFTTVLGVGVFAFMFAWKARGSPRVLVCSALGCAALGIALSQMTPRFFLEPYLWAATAVVGVSSVGAVWKAWRHLLTLQSGLTLAMAAVAAFTLFPGSWTRGLREQVMTRAALGYAEAAWADRVLPGDAITIGYNRSHALLTRPFLVHDALADHGEPAGSLERQLLMLAREQGVNTVMTTLTPGPSPSSPLLERCSTETARTEVRYAARNPFNAGALYGVAVRRLRPDLAECAGEPLGHL